MGEDGRCERCEGSVPQNDRDLLLGARIYKENCAVCHGRPAQGPGRILHGMFPHPPQLFNGNEMVTDDPEGVTFWKVTHGIRLSGMPAFGESLIDEQRWQVTMLLAHADKVPLSVQSALSGN
jgi:thiosulfate dehydrogenase